MEVDSKVAPFKPSLDAALARYEKFKDPTPEDVAKIFGPTFKTIALATGQSEETGPALVRDLATEPITAATVYAAATVCAYPAMDQVGSHAKQRVLDLDSAGHSDVDGVVVAANRETLEQIIRNGRYIHTERAANRGEDAKVEWVRRESVLNGA